MSLSCFFNPHHGCLLRANGHGEVWTDWNSTSKFFQYGWRCTTNEDAYANKTLLGNWNEERYDVWRVLQPKPLPSQYGHYFESTYSSDYSKKMPHSTRREQVGKMSRSTCAKWQPLPMTKWERLLGGCPMPSQVPIATGGGHQRRPPLASLPGVLREPHWFPGHQPELDPPPAKRTARSCYMIDYDAAHSKERGPQLVDAKPKGPNGTEPTQ